MAWLLNMTSKPASELTNLEPYDPQIGFNKLRQEDYIFISDMFVSFNFQKGGRLEYALFALLPENFPLSWMRLLRIEEASAKDVIKQRKLDKTRYNAGFSPT